MQINYITLHYNNNKNKQNETDRRHRTKKQLKQNSQELTDKNKRRTRKTVMKLNEEQHTNSLALISLKNWTMMLQPHISDKQQTEQMLHHHHLNHK